MTSSFGSTTALSLLYQWAKDSPDTRKWSLDYEGGIVVLQLADGYNTASYAFSPVMAELCKVDLVAIEVGRLVDKLRREEVEE